MSTPTKSIKTDKPGIDIKIRTFNNWEPWIEAREFANKCRHKHNIKVMSQVEEERLAFKYGLAKEAADGWELKLFDSRLGLVFVKQDEKAEMPDLKKMFASDPDKVEE